MFQLVLAFTIGPAVQPPPPPEMRVERPVSAPVVLLVQGERREWQWERTWRRRYMFWR